MDVAKLAPYAKTVVAVCGAIVATATVFVDGKLSLDDIGVVVAAWSTAGLVFKVSNKV